LIHNHLYSHFVKILLLSNLKVEYISLRFNSQVVKPPYTGQMVRLGSRLMMAFASATASLCLAADAHSYAGAKSCIECHASSSHAWTGSRHSKMIQPASAASVRGDFARGQIVLRDSPYRLAARSGVYYITETYLTGKPVEHRIDYTLGSRRIQHYLSKLPDGRIIVLPPTWDVLRKDWFHNLDIDDPEEAPGVQVQIWNKSCYGCHVSQQDKNYDLEKNVYKTSWLDFGINCERCHGPASEHASFYSKPGHKGKPAHDVVVQTKLDPVRNSMVCAQCHSLRDIFVDNFAAGDDYFDHFLPILEFAQPEGDDPNYWSDGRPRRFSTDAFALWQSECFLKGKATCLDCHVTPHNTDIERNPQLRPDSNALCTRCHSAVGKALTAHTHHAEHSTGSSCVECHMPRTVFSIKAEIRDHAMTIPVPENTLHHKIPNACNTCHKDKDATWALDRMNAWYGRDSRQKLICRADAFTAARDPRADPAATMALLETILNQPSEGPLPRANALGYLATRFTSDPRVFRILESAMDDKETLIRSIATRFLPQWPSYRNETIAALTKALNDPSRTIRISAAVGLVGLRIRELPGEDGERFKAAQQLFRARIDLNSDDAEQNVAAGRFFLLAADPARAVAAFRASLLQDPTTPAQYLLAGAYAEQGDYNTARKILESIPAGDSQYDRAQRLLKAIESKQPSSPPRP
jgi:predicted CXXCH cytochrome family protein